MSRYSFLCCIFLGFSCFANEIDLSYQSHYPVSQTVYGGIGLIKVPTARASDDGEFAFGVSTEAPYNRLYAKVQFFPWMEVVLRYTEFENTSYEGLPQTAKDKGIDLRLQLMREGEILPSVAMGLIDLGGNGFFSSEFIVASKRFNNLDLTLGLGWGKLGGVDHISNPFGWFSDYFKTRGGRSALGGTVSLGGFYGGEYASFFGGLEYFTPIPNLSVKLEYDSTDYSYDIGREMRYHEGGDVFTLDSQFNIGINYQLETSLQDKIDFSLGFVHGNTMYANLTLHTNLNRESKTKFTAPPEILNTPYLQPFEKLNTDWQKYLTELIIWQMGNEGLVTHNLIFNDKELQVEISQGRFQKPVQAIELASRILGNNSPTNIETITVINIDQGVETLRASIPRKTLVENVAKGPLEAKYLEFNNAEILSENAIIRKNEYLYPNFFWSIKPHLLGTLQHQIQFYFWQIEALIHTEYSITKGLYLTTDVGIDIANNYENYTWHVPDGELHHVRQDRRRYLTEGESGLRRMAFDYVISINSNVTAKLSAGILEWMYGGFGGEVLYIPDNKNWALGVDAYWVKQREFDQKFSFRDYETVTGFVSFYYDLPFYDLRFRGSAGKFLGQDTGVNLDISRRFKTGARVGAMASLTNCDPNCVGEGSFNKWIYFSLPMELFSTTSSARGTGEFGWSPLTKDAGTRVEPSQLYSLMKDAPDEVDSLRRKPWSMKKILSGFGTTAKMQT